MGFVVAGDLLDWEDGKITADQIRERCGRCVERTELLNTIREMEEEQGENTSG